MRSLSSALLVAQIIASAPPLTPSEAAAVLARLDSPANRTHVVAPPVVLPSPVVIVKQIPAPAPQVVFRPLNCCDVYVIRTSRRH